MKPIPKGLRDFVRAAEESNSPILRFTGHAKGAIPNGTRIKKVFSEDGDANKVGTEGVVIGSIHHPDVGFGYFVEWDTFPGLPVFVVEKKISALQT